jgi:hypothetical protein
MIASQRKLIYQPILTRKSSAEKKGEINFPGEK